MSCRGDAPQDKVRDKYVPSSTYHPMHGTFEDKIVWLPNLNTLSCRTRHVLSIFVLCLVARPGSCQFIFNPIVPGNAIIGIPGVAAPSPNFLDQQALAISGKPPRCPCCAVDDFKCRVTV